MIYIHRVYVVVLPPRNDDLPFLCYLTPGVSTFGPGLQDSADFNDDAGISPIKKWTLKFETYLILHDFMYMIF